MNTEHKNDDCPCSCNKCYLLGDSLPEWPRRKECERLDEMLKNVMEDEGGIITDNAKHKITVRGCQRCDQDHEIEFEPLLNPADDWNWWGMCLNTRQPVLMQFISDEATLVIV